MNKLFRKQGKNMDTNYGIVWSKRAKETYFVVLDYLAEYWSKREVFQFMNRVELVLKSLEKNPRMFAGSGMNKNIRKAYIDKNNSMFYSIDTYQERMIILTFFDNRQDPEKFKVN